MQLGILQDIAAKQWRRLALYAVLFVALGTLLFFKLSTLPGGYSASELTTVGQAAGWHTIFNNPVNAPFLAVIQVLSYVYDNTLLATRVVAVCCGLFALALFYGLTRHWHNERVAVFGTVLFGTSAWFLHIARFGTAEVLLFGLLAFVACFLWLRRTKSAWAVVTGFILAALLIYTPGMVWFIVAGVILQWKTIDRCFKQNLWAVTVGGVLLLAALVPLGFAIYHNPEVAKIYAGLPATGWPVLLDVARGIAEVPLQLFAHGPLDPQRWLGQLPILDFFTTAMFFLGAYLYLRHARLGRFWLLVAVFSLGTVLISLGGGVTITILLPFIYLVAASGIGFMLDRWLAVFPRNLIARGVGYGMLSLAVAAVCVYSFRHYYIAWPAAQATHTVYTVHPTAVTSGTIKQ